MPPGPRRHFGRAPYGVPASPRSRASATHAGDRLPLAIRASCDLSSALLLAFPFFFFLRLSQYKFLGYISSLLCAFAEQVNKAHAILHQVWHYRSFKVLRHATQIVGGANTTTSPRTNQGHRVSSVTRLPMVVPAIGPPNKSPIHHTMLRVKLLRRSLLSSINLIITLRNSRAASPRITPARAAASCDTPLPSSFYLIEEAESTGSGDS